MGNTSWMGRPIGALIAYIALGLFLTGPLWGQDPSLAEPVPVDLLRDGELVMPSRNFAIATPPGDWKWFLRKGPGATPSQATYICRETESGAEFQVISSGLAARFDADFITGVKEGIRESLADGGLRIMSLEVTECTTPLPHSFRSQWQAVLPDGRSLYGYGYLTASDTVFTIQHITTDEAEPPLFTQFAGTFRTLRAAAPPASPCFWGMIELLLVGVAYVVGVIVNRGGGRAILNGGTLGAALVIILVVVLVAIGAYTGLARDLPPEKLGEFTGRRIGEALIPLLIAVLISRAHRKRKASINDVSGGPAGETPPQTGGSCGS